MAEHAESGRSSERSTDAERVSRAPIQLPPDELARLAGADPYVLIDLNVRDERSARLFAGSDRGIDALVVAHPERADLLRAEGIALSADPMWFDRPPENGLHEEWRQALTTLTADAARHLAGRAEATSNSFIAARYAHVAWRVDRRQVDAGRLAVRSYVALASLSIEAGAGHTATEALDRAAKIAVVIRDPALIDALRVRIETAADHLEAGYGYRWLLDLSEPIQHLARFLGDELLERFIARLERAVEFLGSAPPADYVARRRFTPIHTQPTAHLADRAVEKLTELRRTVRQSDAVERGALRRGQIWEAHAEALAAQAEPPVAALALRHHLDTAERWYRAASDRASAERIRIRIESLRDRIASEMQHYPFSEPIGQTELDAALRPVLDAPDIDTALTRLADSDEFLPRWAEAQPYRAPQTLGDELFPPVNFDVALNRATGDGQDAAADARESNYYGMALQVSRFFVGHLFWRLRAQQSFTAAAVLRRLVGWPLFDTHRTAFIESAVSAYFRDDHIAFVRTVMPEFESLVRHVAGALGRPTTAPHRRAPGVDEQRGLEDLLGREPALTQALGTDLSYNLQQLLVKKSGLQVRHADAHALLARDFYTEEWSNILMLLLLRLTRVRLPPE